MEFLDRYFHLGDRDTSVGREILGGVTTFMALSYIIFVQPTILEAAGMPKGGVFLATCVASAVACVLMGLLANYPIALAPAMGHNAFFAFTVCAPISEKGFGITEGIALGFISYSGLKLVTGRGKEVHWGFHLVSFVLLLRYIFLV